MIFLNNNVTQNINETLNLIDNEKIFLNSSINMQQKMKDIILNYMQNFSTSTSNIFVDSVNRVHEFLENLKNALDLINKNISSLESLIHHVEEISHSLETNSEELDRALNLFNSEYCNCTKLVCENTLTIQNCLCLISEHSEFKFSENKALVEEKNDFDFKPIPDKISNNDIVPKIIEGTKDNIIVPKTLEILKVEDNHLEKIENQPLNNTLEIVKPLTEETTTSSINEEPKILDNTVSEENALVENTLIVSETSKTVILPYQISKIKNIYENNLDTYSSLEDVVKKKYTLPLSNFKNSSLSRFKETFKLMRKKEKASIVEAFEFAFEVMFNYKLHPAIISACKNLNDLDTYLDSLEDGKSNKFSAFKVLFDLPPTTVKKLN